MVFEQVFDYHRRVASFSRAVANAATLPDWTAEDYARAPATGPELLPVHDALAPLFPYGAPVRGSVLGLDSPGLALALLAPASRAGSWCAVSGFPALGLAAVAEYGIALQRLIVLPDPGKQWATVLATLLDGFDAILVRPPRQATGTEARRIAARARERRSTVVVLGDWPHQVDLRLRVERSRWEGLDHGYGRITGRCCEIVAVGRGAASRQRRVTTWLPPRGPSAEAGVPRLGP